MSECVERSSQGLTWKHLPNVELQFKNYFDQFKTIIQPLLNWQNGNPDSLTSKVFEEGVTNKLVAIYEKSKGINHPDGNVVLLRINGQGTESFIDREDEIVTFLTLNKAGLVPPLYVQFKNGLCYGFAPGRHVTLDEVRETTMMRKISRAIAEINSVPIPAAFKGRKPQVWNKIDEWLKVVPRDFKDSEKQKW